MGYASFLEDIIERMNREILKPFKDEVLESMDKTHILYPRLEAFYRVCLQMKKNIEEKLDWATNPEMDQAFELEKMESENNILISENNDLKIKIENQSSNIKEKEEQLLSHKIHIKNLEREIHKLTNDLELKAETDPDHFRLLIDKYTTKDKQKRYKPEEE